MSSYQPLPGSSPEPPRYEPYGTPDQIQSQQPFGQTASGQPPYGQTASGQPAYGQQPYGQPGYGQPAQAQQPYPTAYPPAYPAAGYPAAGYQPPGYSALPTHPQSSTVLVLGILSLFVGLTGPFAWYYGSKARREIAANPNLWREDAALTVGWVIGIVVSIGFILLFGLMGLGMLAFMAS